MGFTVIEVLLGALKTAVSLAALLMAARGFAVARYARQPVYARMHRTVGRVCAGGTVGSVCGLPALCVDGPVGRRLGTRKPWAKIAGENEHPHTETNYIAGEIATHSTAILLSPSG